jgi:hypothetical protein
MVSGPEFRKYHGETQYPTNTKEKRNTLLASVPR